jgi:gamma-glutamylputrescine oxidase
VSTSYWLEEAAPARVRPYGDAPVDVAVVGAGVTGCSCALTLAEAGLSVRVYEARRVAEGASGRNGGFALRGAALPYDAACRVLGPDRARTLMKLTEETLLRMRDLAGDAFRHTGSLRLAASIAERDDLEAEYEALRADGFDADWREPLGEPLGRLFPAGLWHPPDGAIHPARWVRRLAQRAEEAGAEIVEATRVESVDDLPAEHVVVATDGLVADILAEFPVDAVRGQVLVTEPLPRQLFPFPHYAREGYDYWQQLPDDRLVIGGSRDADVDSELTADEATSDVVQRKIEQLVVRLVGTLPAVTHRWAGIWGTTPDRLPLVGRVPARDGCWVAGGYAGHGNVLGLACGDLVGRAILGERPEELDLFAPGRLQLGAR